MRSARTPYLPTVDLTYSRSGNGFDKYYGIGGQSLAYTNNFAIRLAYPFGVRQPAFHTPNTVLEKVHGIIVGVGLYVLGQSQCHCAGFGRVRENAHRLGKQ